MSDAEETGEPETDPGHSDPPALTPATIDAILADFRVWLADLTQHDPQPAPSPEAVDLFALVGQFTALRHEVNMQTRAARTAVEQNAEILKLLATAQQPESGDVLRPFAKAIIDIADALTLSYRQMEKFGENVEPLLQELSPPAPGFLARVFGSRPSEVSQPAQDKLRQQVAAAADGYAMSLRRVEKLLPELDLEPLECLGEDFDPETMEAVEVVGDSGEPSGTVIEEVRPGYLCRGKVFRFAQVKVAR